MADYPMPYCSSERRPPTSILGVPLQERRDLALTNVGYTPLHVGDRMFVSLMSGDIKAYDANGREQWTVKAGDSYQRLSGAGQILHVGTSLLTHFDDRLFAIDPESGTMEVRARIGDTRLQDAVIHDGALLALEQVDDVCVIGIRAH